jgi:hypothetical protein
MKAILRRMAWMVVALLLLLAASALYAFKSHWFPRLDDRPVFAADKAKAFSPERRAAYEHELFSELPFWNMDGTARYRDSGGVRAREARWREMAADGFELAAIVLRVLDPSGGVVYSPSGPMRRLEELAEQGDTGAMCLMVGLINRAALRVDWRPYQPTYTRWLVEGAQRGHPECLDQLGGRLVRGSDGFQRDTVRGTELKFDAVRAGYVHGAGSLALHFRERGLDDKANVRRVYCWESVRDGVWTFDRVWDGRALLLAELERLHPPIRNDGWPQFIQELRRSTFHPNDCINLGRGD